MVLDVVFLETQHGLPCTSQARAMDAPEVGRGWFPAGIASQLCSSDVAAPGDQAEGPGYPSVPQVRVTNTVLSPLIAELQLEKSLARPLCHC